MVNLVRDALTAGVVLDTWMNGEHEEQIDPEAITWLYDAETDWYTRAHAEAIAAGCPEEVLVGLREMIFGTALYHAQRTKGRREVNQHDVKSALGRIDAFVKDQPLGLTVLRVLYLIISAHEDFNAIAYYGSMAVDDFLLGNLHRPWSEGVFHAQLDHYKQLGLVDVRFLGEGDAVLLTPAGHDMLSRLRNVLEEAGEFSWRANAQRWTIFGELDYDRVMATVAPDINERTSDYLKMLRFQPGMRILEVGCGTGRATIDLGLYKMVGLHGQVVALDPSRALLDRLQAKIRDAAIKNIEVVQSRAEELPFPDNTFDATCAVLSLHFTDIEQAVAEMSRVTKPGGLVSAFCPAPNADARDIPMAALWFRPLVELAETWGLPFGDRNGLAPGALEATFRRHLHDVTYDTIATVVSAEDPESFLAFFLKGAAFFQNILCRVPYAERWQLIQRLETTGQELVRCTNPDEQKAQYFNEAAFGRVPK